MNRRHFLKHSVVALALSPLGPHFARAAVSPTLRVGVIGTGWFGKLDACRLLQVTPAEIVSICDVDRQMATAAAALFAKRNPSGKAPQIFSDYREMLKPKNLDVCIVGTPDHWHALTTIAAIQAGADVYCQKPISVDIVEGQAMLAAARAHQRVVQVGTQRRSSPHLVEARDRVIREGCLGKIASVEMCCYWHMRASEAAPDCDPPANLDYEMWTGPAPMRPFNKLVHPINWRAFMEYSNGLMGDMCVHMYDMARWMLDLGWPRRVFSSGGILSDLKSKANTPDTQTALFDYGDVVLVWNHRTWGDTPDPRYPWACIVRGDKGTLKASYERYEFIPAGSKEPKLSGQPTPELDRYPEDKTEPGLSPVDAVCVRSHMRDFVSAIATRRKPVADIEEAYISTTACILANLSLKLGRALVWDETRGEIRADPEANRLLSRPYRSPWIHPDPKNV
jgi:predicted dehydrogenase